MKEIYQLIEKFNTACEDIAEIKRLLTKKVENTGTQPLQETAAAMPLTNSMKEIVESIGPNPFDRKAIKARLDELKILYQSRANTSTLVKLLESVEAQTVEVEIPGEAVKKQSQTFEAPDQTFEAPDQTFEAPAKDADVSAPKEKPVEEPQAQKEIPPEITRIKEDSRNVGEPLLDLIDKPKEPQKTLELPSLDDFTHMLKSWAVQNGTYKVRKMLADNKVARISELSDEQRAVIWKQCNA